MKLDARAQDAARHVARMAIAAMVVLDLALLPTSLAGLTAAPSDWHGPALYQWLAVHVAALLAVAGAGILAAVVFASGRAPMRSGLLMLLAVHLVYETFARSLATLPPEPILTGSALSGWLLGTLWARAIASPALSGKALRHLEQQYAEATAVALVGATYCLAGVTKALHGGWQWDHRVIWHVLFSFDNFETHGITRFLNDLITSDAALGDLLARLTIGIQIAAIAMVVGPRARLVFGSLILMVHGSMFLFCGLTDFPLYLFALGFLVPWPRLLRRPDGAPVTAPVEDASRRRRAAAIGAAITVALVAGSWALPVDVWMAHRQTSTLGFWQTERPISPPAEAPLAAEDWAALAPIVPSTTLAGWHLDGAVAVERQGVVLRWRRGESVLRVLVTADLRDREQPMRLSITLPTGLVFADAVPLLSEIESRVRGPRSWPVSFTLQPSP